MLSQVIFYKAVAVRFPPQTWLSATPCLVIRKLQKTSTLATGDRVLYLLRALFLFRLVESGMGLFRILIFYRKGRNFR